MYSGYWQTNGTGHGYSRVMAVTGDQWFHLPAQARTYRRGASLEGLATCQLPSSRGRRHLLKEWETQANPRPTPIGWCNIKATPATKSRNHPKSWKVGTPDWPNPATAYLANCPKACLLHGCCGLWAAWSAAALPLLEAWSRLDGARALLLPEAGLGLE